MGSLVRWGEGGGGGDWGAWLGVAGGGGGGRLRNVKYLSSTCMGLPRWPQMAPDDTVSNTEAKNNPNQIIQITAFVRKVPDQDKSPFLSHILP